MSVGSQISICKRYITLHRIKIFINKNCASRRNVALEIKCDFTLD